MEKVNAMKKIALFLMIVRFRRGGGRVPGRCRFADPPGADGTRRPTDSRRRPAGRRQDGIHPGYEGPRV